MEVPGVEELPPAKWTQHCYLKQCCRRDYAEASIMQCANTAAEVTKGKGTQMLLYYWGELRGAHGNQQRKIRPWLPFKSEGDGARMLKKQEHKNQATGVWLAQCRSFYFHMFNCTFHYRRGGQAVNMQGISNLYRQLGFPIFFSYKSSYSRDLCSLIQTLKEA